MTGVRKLHSGELIELRPGHARVTPDAGVTVHASETSGLGNVIPFQRPRATESHAPDVTLPTDAARLPAPPARGEWLVRCSCCCRSRCMLRCSGLSAREPEPLASIGIEVISAEIVLGANEDPGTEKDKGDAPRHHPIQRFGPTRSRPSHSTSRPSGRPSSRRACRSGRRRPRPSRTPRWSARPTSRLPADNAAAPREQRQPAESKPAIAMVTSPDPEMATAAPREIPPDTMDVSLLPQPEEKPVETHRAEASRAAEAGRDETRAEARAGRAAEAGEERRQGQGAPPH